MLGSGSSKAGSLLKLMVYEDDVCLCILDSNPLSHGHSLIIPKCHFPSLEATPPPVPSKEQTNALSKELCSRSKVPDHVFKAINALPVAAHPMTQFANGVMALQVESEFQKAYDKGIPKAKFWEPTYDDCMNLVARLPVVASYVYRRIYKDGKVIPADDSLDYVTMKVVMLAHIQVIWLLVLSQILIFLLRRHLMVWQAHFMA